VDFMKKSTFFWRLVREPTGFSNKSNKTGKCLVVNLGTGNGTSVLKVIEVARRIIGKPIPVTMTDRRAGDPAKLTASARLALETLGWKARFSNMETIISTSWNIYGAAT
jgi:UDP-glucose 4-epimerase